MAPREITLDRLVSARGTVATYIRLHKASWALPIFERLEREIAERERTEGLMARVERVAAGVE